MDVIDIRTKLFQNFRRFELSRVNLSHGKKKWFEKSGFHCRPAQNSSFLFFDVSLININSKQNIETMESGNESKGCVYCTHCDNVVSRSTFQRHERKRCSATSGSEIRQAQETLCSSDSETSSTPIDEGEPVICSCTVRQVKDNNKHSIFNAFRMCPRRTHVCCSRRSVLRCNSRRKVMNLLSQAHG